MHRIARVLLVVLCSVALPSISQAATISLDPSTGTYGPGDTFVVAVRMDNESECINAAHVEVSYPKDALRVVDFGRGGSIFSLWVEEPKIDQNAGKVTFSGGVPGGYCGKVQGDQGVSNVMGKIIFTVINTKAQMARIQVLSTSQVYLNDGLGTKASLKMADTTITLAQKATGTGNPWVTEVQQDTIPPEPFTIEIQSTSNVYSGLYYAVFSTTDKQSGMDHFEVYERGGWRQVSSPYKLPDQSLRENIQIKAVDKAGNERVGELAKEAVPPSQSSYKVMSLGMFIFFLFISMIAAKVYIRHKKRLAQLHEISAESL